MKDLKYGQIWRLSDSIINDLDIITHESGNFTLDNVDSVIIMQNIETIHNSVLVMPITNKSGQLNSIPIPQNCMGIDSESYSYALADKLFHVNPDGLKELLGEISYGTALNIKRNIGKIVLNFKEGE